MHRSTLWDAVINRSPKKNAHKSKYSNATESQTGKSPGSWEDTRQPSDANSNETKANADTDTKPHTGKPSSDDA
jgi:hypothetical protein